MKGTLLTSAQIFPVQQVAEQGNNPALVTMTVIVLLSPTKEQFSVWQQAKGQQTTSQQKRREEMADDFPMRKRERGEKY